jgi:endonuclease/exonuclease/phosphatase family metal-dependent hydrolase
MHGILDHVAVFLGGADVVLGGDFNVAAGYRKIDNGIRFLRGERDLLDRLTKDFGLAPCWQAANPNRQLAQTLRWSGNPSTPYHCDGIFVPRTWLPRLKSCRVVRGSRWTKLSDHNPVVAEFQVPFRQADPETRENTGKPKPRELL